MNKRYKLLLRLLSVMIFVSGIVSCEKFSGGSGREIGSGIQFGASTGYENSSATKTEYSGLDETGASISSMSSWERIDWVSNSDMIRILCEAAGNGPAADYTIAGVPTVNAQKSVAGIAPKDANSLQWGNGDHFFYAMYPVPGMESNYPFANNNPVVESNAQLVPESGNKAVMTGRIPSEQELYLPEGGHEFKANMNYAYMYAAAKVNADEGGVVNLKFRPLVTTIEFTFLTPADDPIMNKLTSVTLSSKTTSLTGTFNATLSTDSLPVITESNVGKVITAILPNGGVQLETEVPYKITLLTLPVDQTDLTLVLNFEGGLRRSLELKDGGSFITIPARKKVYVRNLGVPGSDSNIWTYHISATDPSDLSYNNRVSLSSCKVASYKIKGTKTEAVEWTVEGYYSDPMCETKINQPDWLSRFEKRGTVSPETYEQNVRVDCKAITPVITDNGDTWLPASSFGTGSSKSNYYNLSNPSNMTSDRIVESANCYIVNGPGYYRIPLVMGNGVINNAVNPEPMSFRGRNDGNANYFKDYKGNAGPAIKSPYLHKTGASVGVPTSAHVVWEDVENLIETTGSDFTLADNPISVTGGYNSQVYWLRFHVNDCPTGDGHNYKANAVIAVTDEKGVVMWSWHIWVTDFVPRNYPGYAASRLKDVSVTNQKGETFEIMPLNLGWAPAQLVYTYDPRTVYVKVRQEISGKTAVINVTQKGGQVGSDGGRWPTYQHGRKDAMWPHSGYDNIEKRWFGRAPELVYGDCPIALEELIKSPDRFFGIDKDINAQYLTDGLAYNLWTANATYSTTFISDGNTIVKTIYDPCPAGYTVPRGREFTGFVNDRLTKSTYHTTNISVLNVVDLNEDGVITAAGDYKKGWYFYTNETKTESIYFPSATFRSEVNGRLYYGLSRYACAYPGGDKVGPSMMFDDHQFGITLMDRRASVSIRPVAAR